MKDERKNVWEEFFELKEAYEKPGDRKVKGFHLPEELILIIRRHIRELEDRGIETDYSEMTTLAFMVLFNLKQSDKGFHLRRGKDHVRNLDYYLKNCDKKKGK